MYKAALFLLFFFTTTVFAQDKNNVLYLKADNVPDRIVSVTPVADLCTLDKDGAVKMVFEGKLSEKNLRLSLFFKNKKGTVKIKVDEDGDLRADQRADIEIFGANPAVDKMLYTVEDKKDEVVVLVKQLNTNTGVIEGELSARYWDSAMDSRKLSANIHFSLLLKSVE